MPSKIQLDENLWFLYICLQQSDYKSVWIYRSSRNAFFGGGFDNLQIDFNAVGEATNLKPPAARMRYTRLRRQIEGGTLIGTHGMPFAGGAEKIAEAKLKRKRSVIRREKLKSESTTVSGNIIDKSIKTEHKESSEEYESASSDDSDSEDEIPLAKRRAGQLASADYFSPLGANHKRTTEQQGLADLTLRYDSRKISQSEGELGYTYRSYDTFGHRPVKSLHGIGNKDLKFEREAIDLYQEHYNPGALCSLRETNDGSSSPSNTKAPGFVGYWTT